MTGLHVAVVGLTFGEDFVPLYLAHPQVSRVTLVDTDSERLRRVGEKFHIADRAADLAEVLTDPSLDAVHLVTPVPTHAALTKAALQAGKHVACAVPMALTLADCQEIIDLTDRQGVVYMMMETSLYGREYLYTRDRLAQGLLGEPTWYTGSHIQNLDGYPTYWQGYPPMHYLTHALSPALGLLGTRATRVSCAGSGRLAPANQLGGYDNSFPVQTAHFHLADTAVVASITMAFFDCGRDFYEGFSLFGSGGAVEWPADHDGPLRVSQMATAAPGQRGNRVTTTWVDPPDRPDLLPPELAPFVRDHEVQLSPDGPLVWVPSSHAGSHPHLAHEFICAVVEQRPAAIDARRAAELTVPGLCAHRSALSGEPVEIPVL